MKRSSSNTTKPIYGSQIEGAAGNISGAYAAQAPKIGAISDQLGSLAPDLVSQFRTGNPNVNAAASYNQDVLGGRYLNSNPFLEGIVESTGNSVRNGVAASLGTRGLTGGSAFADIVSRNLASNATGLYGQNYQAERSRMDSAAAQAPQLAAANYLPVGILQSILQSQSAPIQAAAGAGSAVGGLLGQYTNQKQTQNPSILDGIAQALNIAKAGAGFFGS